MGSSEKVLNGSKVTLVLSSPPVFSVVLYPVAQSSADRLQLLHFTKILTLTSACLHCSVGSDINFYLVLILTCLHQNFLIFQISR